MNRKEIISSLAKQFFILTTLISVGVGILGLIFQPETRLGYEAMFYPAIYAIAGLIPTAVMYSRKELPVKTFVVRKIIQFILIEIIVIGIIFGRHVLDKEYSSTVVGVAISILLIYAISHGVSALWDYMDAKKMNEDLEKFLIKNNPEE